MAEELQLKDMQMTGLTDKISGMLQSVSKSKRKELDLQDIAARLKEFEMALDSGNIELRHIGNHPDKTEFKVMLREHKNKLKELRTQYESKKGTIVRDELLGDAEADPTADKLETAEGLMEHGLKIQDKSKQSLERTLGVIAQTKEIGTDTVLKLETNTKQIEGMYDELEMIESSLARSTKIIKRIARKMATDKYIWVMIILLICVVIVIIVMGKVNLTSSSSSSSPSASSTGSRR